MRCQVDDHSVVEGKQDPRHPDSKKDIAVVPLVTIQDHTSRRDGDVGSADSTIIATRLPGIETCVRRWRLAVARRAMGAQLQSERAAGKRILVTEDEFLVALVVEETLQSIGCSVLGPFADLAEATEVATREQVDAAVLDINLRGEMVYPLAEHLHLQGIPFVFTTGYAVKDVPEEFRVFECLQKPVSKRTLEQVVRRMLN